MKAADPLEARRLLDALDAALDLPVAERDRWLAGVAATDPGFGERLRDLLAAHAQVQDDDFLREPVRLSLLAALMPPGDAAAAPGGASELSAGGVIGAYRLVRELGAGGMGVVWLAERADGLFTRPVALKLPHLGLQARAFAERFARERAILAALDHPHIARLYDAGVTAYGQPFLAIEYVEGESLNAYCDRRRLGVAARLQLFIDVLHAVQYAHNQLVVHRDLKPANILVTREGQVKLLDFGIARLLADSASADETSLTQLGGRVLTPDYASPEQIMGGTIATASDIYSLGVVLHELLTGRRPYKLKRDSRGALEDAIVGVEVQRLSETAIDAGTAQQRASDPARLQRQLRGDLETIVLTAMARLPAQRFTTCSAFADDLQRHLDGRPVLARPVSRLHRARKFVLRHRYGVGAVAVVLVLVLGSAGVALVQALRAREEAATAEAIRRFVVGVFERNSSEQPNPDKARSTTARQLLDLGRDQLLNGPAPDPAVAQALMATFSDLYNHLGMVSEALQLDRERLALTKARFGELDTRTLDAQRSVADTLLNEGSYSEEILVLAKDAAAKLERIGDRDSLLRARTETVLAEAMSQRRADGAFERQRHAVELMRRYSDDSEFPVLLANFARSQVAQGDATGARASIEEALRVWQRTPSAAKRLGAYVYGIAGQVYEANDDLRAVESVLRTGVQMEHEIFESWQRHLVWLRLSRLLQRTGRADQVVADSADVLARLRASTDTPPWFHVRTLSIVLQAAVEAGDRRAMGELVPPLQRSGCDGHDAFTEGLCRQALLDARRASGDLRAATALLPDVEGRTQALLERPASMPAAVPIDALTSIARTQLAMGALPQAGQAVQTARQKLSELPIQPVLLDVRLGLVERDVLRARGDTPAARQLVTRLQQRVATHPDRALLSVYERALAD